MQIKLKKQLFTNSKDIFLEYEGLKAITFKYESDICSLILENKYGYIEILPFNGQMIWDAVFNGRSLKMKTPYHGPRKVSSFLDTYGCYMMHCGALAMGCPGPEDTHPLHGELPYADYDTAALVLGEDEKGRFIGVTGTFEYNRAFADNYIAKPIVKLYEDSSVVDVSINIENLSNYPMELMYMCHINNRSVVGGRIVQSAPWDDEHLELRYSIPQHVKVDNDYKEFLEKIKKNSRLTEVIRKEDVYNPEVVFFIHNPNVDEDGWAHFMFINPDGSADYTCYKPGELDHCSRWYVRTKNKEAMGLALPGTADAEGYTAEKKKGNMKILGPKCTFSTDFKIGYISSENVADMGNKINCIK